MPEPEVLVREWSKDFPAPGDEFPFSTIFKRAKKSIYPLVATFEQKKARIEYVAHAYTKGHTYVLLQTPITGTDKSPANHPDQEYWKQDGVIKVLKSIANDVEHIVIDCTLLPCSHGGNSGCLVEVPKKIKMLLGRDVPLVIYSHRKEVADIKAGARFVCNTGDDSKTLNTRLARHTHGWEWYGAP